MYIRPCNKNTEKVERNLMVFAEYTNGITIKKIGKKYNITTNRIRQIIHWVELKTKSRA